MQPYKLDNGFIVPCAREEASIFVYATATEEDRREVFSLPFKKNDLESALDPDEIARIELEDDLAIIIAKRPKRATTSRESVRFEVESVGIFLEPGRLTFIAGQETLDCGAKAFYPGATLMDVVLRYLSTTVHHFLQHLKVIKLITSEIQSKINTSMENKYFIQMFALVESLIYYANSIESNETILLKLKAVATKIKLTEEQNEYLYDVLLENTQCIKQANIYSNVLSGLMDARGNIINNNMNLLLKKLTLINVVFLPLNLLAGIGGMSEFSMMTHPVRWWISYPLFVAGMAGLAWVSWFFIVKVLERNPK